MQKLKEMNDNVPVLCLLLWAQRMIKLWALRQVQTIILSNHLNSGVACKGQGFAEEIGSYTGHHDMLAVGDLELDLDRKVARRGNTIIELTAKEFSLLEYFMRNRGRVLSRNDIAEKVWDVSFDFGTNVVDVYVNFLRKKIDKGFDKKLIQTKVGFGYVFRDS
jgi:DNA-binding response OmpR family regulator